MSLASSLNTVGRKLRAFYKRNRSKLKAALGAAEGTVLNVALLVMAGQSPDVVLTWSWRRWAIAIFMVVLPMFAHGIHHNEPAAPDPAPVPDVPRAA